MKIRKISPHPDWTLTVFTDDSRIGDFDVKPYLDYEAFMALKSVSEFMKVSNGGYFIEWDCGADLSADTIEAHWKTIKNISNMAAV